MADGDSDERLAMQCQTADDARALEMLFRRHISATCAFTRRLLPTTEDAEEAASETWLRAGRALRAGAFRGESQFRTWLFGIARRVCLERRRQSRLPMLSLSDLTETARGDWRLFAPAPEPITALEAALETLSDDYRMALTLCDLQGFTAAEAAQIMVRTTVAMKSLHGRARRALRDALLAQEEQ